VDAGGGDATQGGKGGAEEGRGRAAAEGPSLPPLTQLIGLQASAGEGARAGGDPGPERRTGAGDGGRWQPLSRPAEARRDSGLGSPSHPLFPSAVSGSRAKLGWARAPARGWSALGGARCRAAGVAGARPRLVYEHRGSRLRAPDRSPLRALSGEESWGARGAGVAPRNRAARRSRGPTRPGCALPPHPAAVGSFRGVISAIHLSGSREVEVVCLGCDRREEEDVQAEENAVSIAPGRGGPGQGAARGAGPRGGRPLRATPPRARAPARWAFPTCERGRGRGAQPKMPLKNCFEFLHLGGFYDFQSR
jgi:hypothetical protein